MHSIKNIISLIIFAIFFSIPINSANSQEKNYYQDIVNDWNKIFPDRNNANNDKEQIVISLIYKSFIIFQHYIMSSIVL